MENVIGASGWRKSTRCETSACVEVDTSGDAVVGMRNSTKPEIALALDASAWQRFIEGVRTGEFDRNSR